MSDELGKWKIERYEQGYKLKRDGVEIYNLKHAEGSEVQIEDLANGIVESLNEMYARSPMRELYSELARRSTATRCSGWR